MENEPQHVEIPRVAYRIYASRAYSHAFWMLPLVAVFALAGSEVDLSPAWIIPGGLLLILGSTAILRRLPRLAARLPMLDQEPVTLLDTLDGRLQLHLEQSFELPLADVAAIEVSRWQLLVTDWARILIHRVDGSFYVLNTGIVPPELLKTLETIAQGRQSRRDTDGVDHRL